MSKLSDAAEVADEADEQARVRKKLVLLGIVVVLAVGIYFLFLSPREVSLDALAEQALNAGTLQDRSKAASEIVLRNKADSIVLLRRLVKESKDAEIRTFGIRTLGSIGDWESVPLFFAAMEDQAKTVRQAALEAVVRYSGGQLPDNLKYDADDPAEKRRKVVGLLEDKYRRDREKQDLKLDLKLDLPIGLK